MSSFGLYVIRVKQILSFLHKTYKRVVGFRYVKKGVPQQNGAGVPSGDYAVMVGNTLFDVAVGLTSAVPT